MLRRVRQFFLKKRTTEMTAQTPRETQPTTREEGKPETISRPIDLKINSIKKVKLTVNGIIRAKDSDVLSRWPMDSIVRNLVRSIRVVPARGIPISAYLIAVFKFLPQKYVGRVLPPYSNLHFGYDFENLVLIINVDFRQWAVDIDDLHSMLMVDVEPNMYYTRITLSSELSEGEADMLVTSDSVKRVVTKLYNVEKITSLLGQTAARKP